MPKRRAPPKKPKDQHAKFVEAARQLGADMSEDQFKETIRQLGEKPKDEKKG